jgi:hypothetical protein
VQAIGTTAVLAPAPCPVGSECRTGLLSELDPATGAVALLAHQPFDQPLSGPTTVTITSAAFDDRGGLWAAGVSLTGVSPPVTAYSLDRGRSWRLLPRRPGTPGIRTARICPLPDGRGAYLIGSREDQPNDFAALFRIGDPTAADSAWAAIDAEPRPQSILGAVGLADGSLMFTASTGGARRVTADGALSAVPTSVDGVRFTPYLLSRGANGVLYAQDDSVGTLSLAVSEDQGRTWRRSLLPSP